MRKIFLCSMMVLFTLGLSVHDASAGRFGGGRGFGSMRSSSMFSHTYNAKRPAFATAARNTAPSRLKGMFTGMLMGGLLASLFMGHGMGSTLMSWLFLGIAVFMIIRLVNRQKQNDDFQSRGDF